MRGRMFAGLFLVLVLVVGGLGLSAVAYNVGVSQGIMQGSQIGQAPGVEQGSAVRTIPAPYFYPRPFGFGFGLGGLLIAGLVLFVIFGVLRMIFWRGAMMGPMGFRRRMGHWGNPGSEGIPPMVEEWHKQMHSKEAGKSESPGNPQV